MKVNELVWHAIGESSGVPAPTSYRDMLVVNLSSYGGEPNFALLVGNNTNGEWGWIRCDTLKKPSAVFWENANAYTAIRWTQP